MPAKKKNTKNSQRSADYMRKLGWQVGFVEQTIRMPNREKFGEWTMFKRDLWNCFDLIAVHPVTKETCGVQTTTRSNQASRVQKIRETHEADVCLRAGWKIYVHGWKQLKTGRWEVAITELTQDGIQAEIADVCMNDTLFATETGPF